MFILSLNLVYIEMNILAMIYPRIFYSDQKFRIRIPSGRFCQNWFGWALYCMFGIIIVQQIRPGPTDQRGSRTSTDIDA